MLTIQPPSSKTTRKCALNVLPCRIHQNGPAKITKRFWSPTGETDGSKTAYFRGRRLRGRVVKLPAGYQGLATRSTERTLPVAKPQAKPQVHHDDEDVYVISDEEEEEDEPEAVKIMDTIATFDNIVVWGHDQLAAADDTFVKGVEEWIAFAEAIHLPSTEPEDKDRKKATSS